MAKLSDLKLTNEGVGEALDYATMPDQMGGFTPPPQPGPYRFKLPLKLDGVWEVFDHTKGNPPGQRISAQFNDAAPLLIVQSPGGLEDGAPFQTKISNAERKRGKKDDQTAPWISDMDYVFRDVFGLLAKPGPLVQGKPRGANMDYAQEFMRHAGEEFGAELTWSWRCNPNKNVFVDNGQQGLTEVVGQLGCGTGYYMKDVQKVPSDPADPSSPKVYPLRITCQCGANVRAFANLEQFRK